MKHTIKNGKNQLEITPNDSKDFKSNWVKEITGLKDWTNDKGEVKKVADGKFCQKNFVGKSWVFVCNDGIFQVCENGEKTFVQFGNGLMFELLYSEVMEFLNGTLGAI